MQGNCLDFNIFLYSTKLIPLIIIIIISILTFNLVNHLMSFLSSMSSFLPDCINLCLLPNKSFTRNKILGSFTCSPTWSTVYCNGCKYYVCKFCGASMGIDTLWLDIGGEVNYSLF